ncbi:MAG: F0F1 ATP synthase subunit epsilon [Acidobacteria bacterium]|nr:F0F1 ATP synthase subunit epsilon [Acidobacteriota bacterium]MBU4306717.1 F0F1 ATP synthase subunit epsilon [Acidobacteriota bacterium]MBU4405563.1 F0F1 ATP synthase subunit epsilon [Acidobacteriota bacterium]MCG2810326.1 F0F1 ATP synthase subunit epsilon [Candidatus Aminicenantes bacterium]
MADAIELEIITSREVVLRTEIKDLYIPAFLGEAGVLSHHLPYLSLLNAGEISYLKPDGTRLFLFSGEGFLEVRDNRIALIIDTFEHGEDLREEDLQKQMQETEKRIKSSFQGAITPSELQVELLRQRELRLKLAICKKIKGK